MFKEMSKSDNITQPEEGVKWAGLKLIDKRKVFQRVAKNCSMGVKDHLKK